MIVLNATEQAELSRLVALGYCRTSCKHRHVTRIDREDWKKILGRNFKGRANNGANEDFYRRVYSRDTIVVSARLLSKFPPSGFNKTGYIPRP